MACAAADADADEAAADEVPRAEDGTASVSDSVKARGVSSRIVSDSGRVEGDIVCHVDGLGLAMVWDVGRACQSPKAVTVQRSLR